MSSAALSQLVGPWLSSRAIADLPAEQTNALVAALLLARRWTDLSDEHRALLLRARAYFEASPVADHIEKAWEEERLAAECRRASAEELDAIDARREARARALEDELARYAPPGDE